MEHPEVLKAQARQLEGLLDARDASPNLRTAAERLLVEGWDNSLQTLLITAEGIAAE